MNRNFQATSKRARATFAIAAVLVSVLIGSGIDGLVDHYQGTTQMASNTPVVVAQR
jgi:hypothetical protein